MVKTERTFPAPKSLAIEKEKASGSYSNEDVIVELNKIFHNKCYICEINDLQDPEIEHLLPHKNGLYHDRKFDWNNLFWACGHCNSVKMNTKYDEKILDCCKEDPERKIRFLLMDGKTNVTAIDPQDEISDKTAELVWEVFNLCNTGMRVYKSAMRLEKLEEQLNILYDCLEKYRRDPSSNLHKRQIELLLSRASSFAAFKRCYIRENIDNYPEFKEYIN